MEEINENDSNKDVKVKTEANLAELDVMEKEGWPDYLIKAVQDTPFDYMLQLRTGVVIFFRQAEYIDSGWVRLKDIEKVSAPPLLFDDNHRFAHTNPCFERGMDVRLSDIVWVADAPYGS